MLQLTLISLLFLAPAGDADLLEAVPADAQILFSIDNVSGLNQTAAESSWGKFFSDPGMADCIDYWLEMADIKTSGEEEEFDPVKFWDSVGGGLTLFARLESVEDELFGVGVLAEPGDRRDAFDEFLDEFKAFMLGDGQDMTDSVEEYGDWEIEIFEKTTEEGDQPAFMLCDMGETVLAVVHSDTDKGIGLAREVIDLIEGVGEAESIVDAPGFTSAREAAGGSGMIEFFIDAEALIEIVAAEVTEDPDIGEMEGIILKAMGFRDMTAVYAKADIGEGEAVDSYFFFGIEGEGALRGFIDCADGALPRDLLKLMPKESVSASVGWFDLNALYTKILDLVRAVNEDAYNSYRGAYDMFLKQQYGIDPEKEIIALSSGRWGSFSVELPENEIPSGDMAVMTAGSNIGKAYVVGLSDAPAFQANLEKILKAVGLYMAVQSEEFQGNKIYSFSFPGMAIKLNWVIGTDVAGFALFPSVARSFVRVLSSDEQPSVLEREDYITFLESASGSSWFTVAEIAANLKNTISVFQMALSTVAASSGQGELLEAPFPDAALVDKYFKGVIATYLEVDEKGVHVRLVSR